MIKDLAEVQMTLQQDPLGAHSRALELLLDPSLTRLIQSSATAVFSSGYATAVERYKEIHGTSGVTGLPTPFPMLTYATKGWQSGGYYVIYAPRKNYKSHLLLWIIRTLYLLNVRLLVVTSEMPTREMDDRLLCMLAGGDYNQFIDGKLPTDVLGMLEDDIPAYKARTSRDIHYLVPTGTGDEAVAEVRGRIQDLNADKQLAAVFWDGHHRSSKSEEWRDVYHLSRATRQLALDERLGQPPLIITTNEGSIKGAAANRVYEEEATALMRLHKPKEGEADLSVQAIRKGHSCWLRLKVDFTNTSMSEIAGKLGEYQESQGFGQNSGLFT